MNKISEIVLNSKGYILINNTLGVEVSSERADERVPVASLTKIMTALVALERCELNETVRITNEMLTGLEGFAKIGLRVGQEATVEDLVYATMLPSAGDAAQALAVKVGGTLAGFVNLMNQKAEELGLVNTHFNNAVGMDEDNYSTPGDVAKLVQEAIKNPEFERVFGSFERELTSLRMTVKKTFEKIAYVKGGKTGFTNDAGRCLATVAEVEGTQYILVTVGAEEGQNVKDAEKIYAEIETGYEPVEVMREGEWIVRIPVRGSATEEVEFLAERDVVVALENEVTGEDLSYEYTGREEITRDAREGEELGKLVVKQGEQELYAQEIRYEGGVDFYNYGWVGLGVGVSLLGLAIGVLGCWKLRKLQKASNGKEEGELRRKRFWAAMGVGGMIGGLVALIVSGVVFSGWFREEGDFAINRPEWRVVEEWKTSEEDKQEQTGSSSEISEISEEPATPVVQSMGNCTTRWGNLMLINPNFKVGTDFIAARERDLVSVSARYGIPEYNRATNGDNLLTAEAAEHLNEMVRAYEVVYPGHTMGTRSCFRRRGTNCGRLCAATGASDHHTGLTCDLIDTAYGTSLDTDDYARHIEWQWLRENSYKYGFIDRFPEAWAGGSMSEPLNVDANGTTGLYETWHYRYVGVTTATEIATGKYNGGKYDSLEHYLKVTGRVVDLKNGVCAEK